MSKKPKQQPLPAQIEAAMIRPVAAHSATRQTAALEIVQKNGDRLLVVLSGEGLKKLHEDIGTFLDENPEMAELRSERRQ